MTTKQVSVIPLPVKMSETNAKIVLTNILSTALDYI